MVRFANRGGNFCIYANLLKALHLGFARNSVRHVGRSVPSREIFWAASRLPDSARQRTPARFISPPRSPSAAATRLLHRAASSSLGFFIARQLPSPPPHNIFIAIWHCARNFLAGWRVGKNFGKGLDENAKRLEIPPLGTLQTHLQLCKSPEMQS